MFLEVQESCEELNKIRNLTKQRGSRKSSTLQNSIILSSYRPMDYMELHTINIFIKKGAGGGGGSQKAAIPFYSYCRAKFTSMRRTSVKLVPQLSLWHLTAIFLQNMK